MKEIIIARNSSNTDLYLCSDKLNRHGLIAGATGTGKTVTLQKIAHELSLNGIPVFMADIKGDLSGVASDEGTNPKIEEKLKKFFGNEYKHQAAPTVFWDVFGAEGHPLRTTVSDMGPVLLSRVFNLNDTQASVLSLIFKIADDQKLLLIDLKDLKATLQYVGENTKSFMAEYGNIAPASLATIQRAVVAFESEGAAQFFGEPAINILDFMQTDTKGYGQINLLAASKLSQSPKFYSMVLLWLLAELFEELPEVGDLEKPKLVFFFDEAHLLFTDAPKILLEKIEQVVRLVRSKGIGIYFITQSPLDVPETVLSQLGNRVQHALRAFTPKDQKAVKVAAQTFRQNPNIDTEKVITELGIGEALVSFMDESGKPSVVDRVEIIPPLSRIGALELSVRKKLMAESPISGYYEKLEDSVSAFETLHDKAKEKAEVQETQKEEKAKSTSSRSDGIAMAVAKSAGRSIATQIGKELVRGLLGSLLGGSTRRRR